MTTKKSKRKTNNKTQRTFSNKFLIIAAIAILFIFFVVAYNRYLTKKSAEYQSEIKNTNPSSLINFAKTGTLIKNVAGLKKDTWYLKYTDPGLSPANIEVNFNKNSLCQSQDKNKVCDTSKFKSGQNVRVTGNNTNGLITISTLTDVAATAKK
jgi:cytoskeletal protein RodZ